MDDRPHNKKMGKLERSPPSTSSNSRKSKKRIARQNKQLRQNNWTYEPIQPDEATQPPPPPPPPMDYGPVFYQQPSTLPPHMQQGQRLFTAMSDPSVCGYSPMPMAYAMEPVSMPPIYPLYRPVPQPNYRQFGNRTRRNIQRQPNGYSSLQENRTHYLPGNLHQNGGDYASLPPTANNDERSDADEVNSEHRRYSDPGLGPADVARDSDESDSGESASSITTVRKGSKIVLSLVEQMTNLREANSRMFKDLHDTKLSLENTKSELSRVKQQGGLEYQPGMIADIIGEMREANKILEETMTARLTAIIEEKNNERLSELYDVKERLAKMTEEKNEADKRIAKLEEEIARLKISVKNEGEIAAFEEETLALRRELQEARSASSSSSSSSVNRHQSSKEPTKLRMMSQEQGDMNVNVICQTGGAGGGQGA